MATNDHDFYSYSGQSLFAAQTHSQFVSVLGLCLPGGKSARVGRARRGFRKGGFVPAPCGAPGGAAASAACSWPGTAARGRGGAPEAGRGRAAPPGAGNTAAPGPGWGPLCPPAPQRWPASRAPRPAHPGAGGPGSSRPPRTGRRERAAAPGRPRCSPGTAGAGPAAPPSTSSSATCSP